MAQSAQVEHTDHVAQRTQWEHLTIIIKWDTGQEQWTSDWPDGHPHRTLDGLLDQVGTQGWELANVAPFIAASIDSPARYPVPIDFHVRLWAPTQYQAFFKRRKRG